MTAPTDKIPRADRVADQLAIERVLNLHSRGLDRLQADTIQQAYWPDAQVDYGSYKGNAHVFAELVVGALGDAYELTRHSLSNTLIEFTGSSALSESSVSAAHLLKGAEQEMHFYGRYLDTLEQRDGIWKIRHRQVVMDWSKRITVQDEREDAAFCDMAKGAHGEADPLHSFLTITK